MTRVLLTGGQGFVGRQILRALLESGVHITSIERPNGRHPSLAQRHLQTKDLFAEEPAWLARACENVDVVVHAAWYAEPGRYLHSPLNLQCLVGSLMLAQAAAAAGVRRFIGLGTCFEYDLSRGVLSLETPLRPITPYGAAKASLYMSLAQCLPPAGTSLAWCRLFYLFGEGEDPRRLAPYVQSRLAAGLPAELTSGKQIRDYLDVAEAGRRIAALAIQPIEAGSVPASKAYNICSGVPTTVRQFAEALAATTGRLDLLHFGARADNAVDPPCVLGIPTFVP